MWKDPDIGKPAEQLKKERYDRMHAANVLKVPDRVPVIGSSGVFAYERLGITRKMLMSDMKKRLKQMSR
jgi:hypothetical protein